jgi:ParB family chromosome partitioning protein
MSKAPKATFKNLKLSDIVVDDRARKEFGDLEELMNSIKEKGIIQPISVSTDGKLLAGGRRYEASVRLELPTIPALIRQCEGTIDAKEIELYENIHRKDFEWHERAKLTKEIDDLYKQKHGTAWSGRKTAELLDRSKSQVSRDIELAGALDALPELANVKTADEAMKVVKGLQERALVAELRTRQDIKMNNDEHGDLTKITNQMEQGVKIMLNLAKGNYVIGDTFKFMEKMKANESIHIIECDPPYGIDLNDTKASKSSATSNVHTYEEVEREDYPAFLEKLCKEMFRIAGKDCWLIFWYGPTWHQAVLDNLRRAGWAVDEIPGIWAKPQGQTMHPETYFARCYEPFFICRKGSPVMVERGRSNVLSYAGVPGKTKYHPTQRPVGLISELFTRLGAGQQRVFIPFLGSGASLLSCYEVGFQGFGCDLNGEYKDKFMLEVEAQTRRQYDTTNSE